MTQQGTADNDIRKKSVSVENTLADNYQATRKYSLSLIASLSAEDSQLQAMADVSPLKWHLAHTSWFFETFILSVYSKSYRAFAPEFKVLFISYYNGIGEQFKRAERGSLATVIAYRTHIDSAIQTLLSEPLTADIA